MTADDLAMQESRPSAAIAFTWFPVTFQSEYNRVQTMSIMSGDYAEVPNNALPLFAYEMTQ